MLGPRTSKYIPDIWLKRLFVVLAFYVGVGYFLRGFFDIRLPGVESSAAIGAATAASILYSNSRS
jgi:hypothetical protein